MNQPIVNPKLFKDIKNADLKKGSMLMWLDTSKEPHYTYTLQVMSVTDFPNDDSMYTLKVRILTCNNPEIAANAQLDIHIKRNGPPVMGIILPDGKDTLDSDTTLKYSVMSAIQIATFQLLKMRPPKYKVTKAEVVEYMKAMGIINEDMPTPAARELVMNAITARPDIFVNKKGPDVLLKDAYSTLESLTSPQYSASSGILDGKEIDKEKFIHHVCGLMEVLGYRWQLKELK